MNKPSKTEIGTLAIALCLALLFIQTVDAQFVEILAEIETFGYELGKTNAIANAKPRTTTVVCITGSNQWWITNDFHQAQQWLFDGSKVRCRKQISVAKGSSEPAGPRVWDEQWESRDGHPMGDFGVNLPWLAFCAGTCL